MNPTQAPTETLPDLRMDLPDAQTTRLAIDAVRVLSMDAVQSARSGHPGTPMALAPAGYVLWRHHLRHNPANPTWANRDRFVLSCGHASMLLYSLLHLTGYGLPLDEIKRFRQWGSRAAGHPEFGEAPGVETTTGPLGQGVANSVGMALAERWLAARFNRPGLDVVDHWTYVFCSDGDLMEGISHEAASIAGHQRLGKLVWVFDDNRITIDGSTDLSTSTDQVERFRSYGWQTLDGGDGNDLEAFDAALRAAREDTGRPTLISLHTTIGWGSPNKAGSADAHGSPLGEDEVRLTKEVLGYPSQEPFWVADEARAEWAKAGPRGQAFEAEWRDTMERYRSTHPDLAAELDRFLSGELPEDWDRDVPDLLDAEKPAATRSVSGTVIQGLAARIPNLVGGSADLTGSNKTDIKGAEPLLPSSPDGRNIYFGVREHAMGGILNGMTLHGGLHVHGGTFLIFSDYMRPSIRLAALMGLPVRYVFTHDSIGLGEDGPTHQPIEQLMALRAIPGLVDLRPADAAETSSAWKIAMRRSAGPSFLALTRQGVPPLDRSGTPNPAEVEKGGYVFREASGGEPEVILIASGSELQFALDARDTLEAEGIPTRVVSLMSWALFEEQDRAYQDRVLPPDVTVRASIEAGSTFGWHRWVGRHGQAIGLDHFGASAPYEDLYEHFGISTDALLRAVREILAGEET